MLSREAVDQKYKRAAAEQGLSLEILYAPGLPKAQELRETEGGLYDPAGLRQDRRAGV